MGRGAGGRDLDVPDPADGAVVARVALARAADVDDAVARRAQAFASGRGPACARRAGPAAVDGSADLIEADTDELALLDSLDNGKPLREARVVDVPLAVEHFRYYAGWADKIDGPRPSRSSTAHCFAYTLREPVGVVGAIIPWNFPLLMAAWKLGPGARGRLHRRAQAGRADAAVGAARWRELAQEAGFPPGVVNIVTGLGDDRGRRAGRASRTSTRSPSPARPRRAARSSRRRPATLKRSRWSSAASRPTSSSPTPTSTRPSHGAVIGGSSSTRASAAAPAPGCSSSASIHDEFVERLAERRPAASRLGARPRPRDDQMGPLVSARQLERVARLHRAGRRRRRHASSRRRRLADGRLAGGYFVRADGVRPASTTTCSIAREEIFGPVVAVMPFDDRTRSSAAPTTPPTAWPPASGRATSQARPPRGRGSAGRHRLGQHLRHVRRGRALRRLQAERLRPRAGRRELERTPRPRRSGSAFRRAERPWA